MRKALRGALALGLVLGGATTTVGPAAAGTSANTPVQAERTWKPDGKQIEGTASSADAPLLKSGGTYRDTIRPGETKHYAADLDGRSTAYFTAFGFPAPGSTVSFADGLRLEVKSSDGAGCGSEQPGLGSGGLAHPVGDTVRRVVSREGDDSCDKSGHYLFAVTRKAGVDSDKGAWPLELGFLTEPGLKKGKQPRPAVTTAESPEPVTGRSRRTVGGGSPDEAPSLAEGVWRDSIRPGETVYYKVPLDWGQSMSGSVDLANAPDPDAPGSLPTSFSGYSPAMKLIDSTSNSYFGEEQSTPFGTTPVEYASRWESGSEVSPVSVAGSYYLVLSLGKKAEDSPLKPGQKVDVTLRLRVRGAAAPAPAYAGKAPAVFTVTEADQDAAEKGKRSTAAGAVTDTSRKFFGYVSLGGGTVLLIGVLTWVLRGRRRSLGRPGQGPVPGQQPYPEQPPAGWGGPPQQRGW